MYLIGTTYDRRVIVSKARPVLAVATYAVAAVAMLVTIYIIAYFTIIALALGAIHDTPLGMILAFILFWNSIRCIADLLRIAGRFITRRTSTVIVTDDEIDVQRDIIAVSTWGNTVFPTRLGDTLFAERDTVRAIDVNASRNTDVDLRAWLAWAEKTRAKMN